MRKPIHFFTHNDKLYQFFVDELHQTKGSYAYDTPEETEAAENEEISKLQSGEWIVLGVVEYERCDGHSSELMNGQQHCSSCEGWDEKESVWGCVLDNNTTAWEKFVTDGRM